MISDIRTLSSKTDWHKKDGGIIRNGFRNTLSVNPILVYSEASATEYKEIYFQAGAYRIAA